VKTKLIIALLFTVAVVLVLVLHNFRGRPAALTSSDASRRSPSSFEEATDTCVSDSGSEGIVVLRVSNGSLSINSEPVGEGQLPQRLRGIYATRPERVLYLLPDKEASFRRVVDVANVVRHLRAESVSERPVPKELQSPRDELMNIQVRLVTARATNAPCPKGYFSWATQGLPVYP
jgi:biopolymer transport protein ExbD